MLYNFIFQLVKVLQQQYVREVFVVKTTYWIIKKLQGRMK